jgi:type I restriction enzyme S subunit
MEAIGENGELDISKTKKLGEVSSGYTYLAEGDVCIAKITPCFENGKGAIVRGLTNGVAFATTEVIPLRCNTNCDPKYLYCLLTSAPFNKQAEGSMYGAGGQKRVADSFVANYHFAAPTLPEQRQIAKFLDHETGKIDLLIEKQQALIALLKEKRQAVISHAVTKGLNPHAKMKDSGVEWLGEVPEHWEVKPLKYLMSLSSGGTPSKGNLAYWDGTVPWASSKDLKPEELFDTQDHITQKALDDKAAQLVPSGSILTVVRGMILQHTFPVVVARVPMAFNQDLKSILPTSEVDADFLSWLLRGASDVVLSSTDEAGHGTKVLRMETWLAIPVPVPPLKEQACVAANIVKRLDQLDTLNTDANHAIQLMQERRTALISAAVTGKIDVRDWEPAYEKLERDGV